MCKNKTLRGVLIAAAAFLLIYAACLAVSVTVRHITLQNTVVEVIGGEKLKQKNAFRENELHGYTGREYSYITAIGLTEAGINGYPNHTIPRTINKRPVCFTADALEDLFREKNGVWNYSYNGDYEYYVFEDGMLFSPDNAEIAFYFGSGGDIIIPQGVEKIGAYAFYDCGLTSLVLPDSVTELGEGAFADNNISQLTLSASLENIGGEALAGLNVEELVLPESVKEIGKGAFSGGSMRYASLPAGLEKLEHYAFGNCEQLEMFDINCPYSVISDVVLFGANYENGGRLVINSAEPFYPLEFFFSMLAYDEILINEPCAEEGFDFTRGYDKYEHNTTLEVSLETRGGERALVISVPMREKAVTVHFAFNG